MARIMGGARNAWLLLLLLLAGGVAGSAVGAAMASFAPILNNSFNIGLGHTTFDLKFFSLSFGFHMAVGPLTALGFLLGYLAYRKL